MQFESDIIAEVVRPPNIMAVSRFQTVTAGWGGNVYLFIQFDSEITTIVVNTTIIHIPNLDSVISTAT